MKSDLQAGQRYSLRTNETSSEIIIPNKEGRALIWIPSLMLLGWAIAAYKFIYFLIRFFENLILGFKSGSTASIWGGTIISTTNFLVNPWFLVGLSILFSILFIIWLIVGKFLFEETMWRIVGKEILEITQRNITISHSFLLFSRKRIYSAKNIQSYRVFDEGFDFEHLRSKIATYRGLLTGIISAEYENGNTIKFGNLLKMDDAEKIVTVLNQKYFNTHNE